MFLLDVLGDPNFDRTIRVLWAFLIHTNYVQRSIQVYAIYPEISVVSFPKKPLLAPSPWKCWEAVSELNRMRTESQTQALDCPTCKFWPMSKQGSLISAERLFAIDCSDGNTLLLGW